MEREVVGAHRFVTAGGGEHAAAVWLLTAAIHRPVIQEAISVWVTMKVRIAWLFTGLMVPNALGKA